MPRSHPHSKGKGLCRVQSRGWESWRPLWFLPTALADMWMDSVCPGLRGGPGESCNPRWTSLWQDNSSSLLFFSFMWLQWNVSDGPSNSTTKGVCWISPPFSCLVPSLKGMGSGSYDYSTNGVGSRPKQSNQCFPSENLEWGLKIRIRCGGTEAGRIWSSYRTATLCHLHREEGIQSGKKK